MRDVDLPIATDGDAGGLSSRAPPAPGALLQIFPTRLHAGTAVRLSGGARAVRPELPSHRSAADRRAAVAVGHRPREGAGPQHAVARLRIAAGVAAVQPHAQPAGAAAAKTGTALAAKTGRALNYLDE